MNAQPPLTHWNPEDPGFWRDHGSRVATRNLVFSALALVLSFAVWMLWSVVVVHLPSAGFRFSPNQLFWLAALPALSGATLRAFFAFAVPLVGGRRWAALSTAALLLPLVGMGWALQRPDTPYEILVLLALLCGIGGGNFASAMAHVSHFYPAQRQGFALGLTAGLGHLGVPLMQAAVPLAIAAGSLGGALGGAPALAGEPTVWLANAAWIWITPVAVAALACWFGMNDLRMVSATFAEQAVIFTRKHNWLMCWLYLGTFGSFIGFSAALPLLWHSQFPDAQGALQLAWLGPLAGTLARPLGGWLADRHGGARITLWAFGAMVLGVLVLLLCLPGAARAGSLPGFLASFALLFAAAGVGNGSTFRMIPVIFLTERQRAARRAGGPDESQAAREGHTEAAAALGFASAIGAYGGFVVPKSMGSAIALTGDPGAALVIFIAFYLSCMAITWWHYGRRHAPMPC
jgi:MFS transporter, NNP family, nitrate/nitrite transporter